MKTSQLLLISLLLAAGQAAAHGDKHEEKAPAPEEAGAHAAALGQPGDPAKATRTVAVSMSDAMRFSPASVKVSKGETIRFAVKNHGKIKHELVLGTLAELKEHAQLMVKFPQMEHDDPNAVSVEPGKTGEPIWRFGKAGNFDFACLVPGHFEAGMRGKIAVSEPTIVSARKKP